MVALWLVACDPDEGSDGTTFEHSFQEEGIVDAESWADVAAADGRIEVPIEVGADTTSFLVSVSSSSSFPRLDTIVAPDGQEVVDGATWRASDETLSTAFAPPTKTAAFTWPARASDPALVPGAWIARFTIVHSDDSPSGDTPLDVAVYRKADPDLVQGTLGLRVVYAAGVDDDPSTVAAIDQAVDELRATYAGIGITLDDSRHPSGIDPSGSFTSYADPQVAATAAQVAGLVDVVMVVADDIGGSLGSTPAVPGSPAPTGYRYCAVALEGHRLNGSVDTTALAQTMTHEVSHVLGLSHVVEIPDYDQYDALGDTPRCDDWVECEGLMDYNLMYPHVNCNSSGVCIPNFDLTGEQAAMLHRAMGVR